MGARCEFVELAHYFDLQALSNAELRAFLLAAKAHRERDWLMFLVQYNHGLRASELVSFMRDAVRDGFLTIDRVKGSLRTHQPLITHLDPLLSERDALIDYAKQSNFSKPVFAMSTAHLRRLFHRHAETAGIPEHKSHPHVLKHTCGRQLIATEGIHFTQAWLGHKSMASTGVYTKATEEEAAAAAQRALSRA